MGCHVIQSPFRSYCPPFPAPITSSHLTHLSSVFVSPDSTLLHVVFLFAETLILMQQAFHTFAKLFQINASDPEFTAQFQKLRSQVSALFLPLSVLDKNTLQVQKIVIAQCALLAGRFVLQQPYRISSFVIYKCYLYSVPLQDYFKRKMEKKMEKLIDIENIN